MMFDPLTVAVFFPLGIVCGILGLSYLIHESRK